MNMVTRERLLEYLAFMRSRRVTVNNTWTSRLTFYAPPTIAVTDGAWEHVVEAPWDHSMEMIYHFAEIAAPFGGWVSIVYDVHMPGVNTTQTTFLDEGFEVQVWPEFALRTHNTFTPISNEDDEDE